MCCFGVRVVDAFLVKDSVKISKILDALTIAMQDHFTGSKAKNEHAYVYHLFK